MREGAFPRYRNFHKTWARVCITSSEETKFYYHQKETLIQLYMLSWKYLQRFPILHPERQFMFLCKNFNWKPWNYSYFFLLVAYEVQVLELYFLLINVIDYFECKLNVISRRDSDFPYTVSVWLVGLWIVWWFYLSW